LDNPPKKLAKLRYVLKRLIVTAEATVRVWTYIEKQNITSTSYAVFWNLPFYPYDTNSVWEGRQGMFEEVFASALYMLVMFFGVIFAFIILAGYYWTRQIRSIYLRYTQAAKKQKSQA